MNEEDLESITTPMVRTGGLFIAHVPDEPGLLAAVGRLALRHAHLDHALIGMIKTLSGVTMPEADAKHNKVNSAELRRRVEDLSRDKFGEADEAHTELIAILERCETATLQRNRFIHAIWYIDHATDEVGLYFRQQAGPAPSTAEVAALAIEVEDLANELNRARKGGFIQAAMLPLAKG